VNQGESAAVIAGTAPYPPGPANRKVRGDPSFFLEHRERERGGGHTLSGTRRRVIEEETPSVWLRRRGQGGEGRTAYCPGGSRRLL